MLRSGLEVRGYHPLISEPHSSKSDYAQACLRGTCPEHLRSLKGNRTLHVPRVATLSQPYARIQLRCTILSAVLVETHCTGKGLDDDPTGMQASMYRSMPYATWLTTNCIKLSIVSRRMQNGIACGEPSWDVVHGAARKAYSTRRSTMSRRRTSVTKTMVLKPAPD